MKVQWTCGKPATIVVIIHRFKIKIVRNESNHNLKDLLWQIKIRGRLIINKRRIATEVAQISPRKQRRRKYFKLNYGVGRLASCTNLLGGGCYDTATRGKVFPEVWARFATWPFTYFTKLPPHFLGLLNIACGERWCHVSVNRACKFFPPNSCTHPSFHVQAPFMKDPKLCFILKLIVVLL